MTRCRFRPLLRLRPLSAAAAAAAATHGFRQGRLPNRAIGARFVRPSTPDGYTLLMAPMTSNAMSEKTFGAEAAGYEVAKDV